MSAGKVSGEVHCKKAILPCETPRRSNACSNASSDGALSPLSSLGRRTTSAPYARLTAAISSSSVETTTLSIVEACKAASMVQAIKGLPQNGSTFFLGIPLDPPRAGMMASAPKTDTSLITRYMNSVRLSCVVQKDGFSPNIWSPHAGSKHRISDLAYYPPKCPSGHPTGLNLISREVKIIHFSTPVPKNITGMARTQRTFVRPPA